MSDSTAKAAETATNFPPHPGSQQMPRWDGGELPESPVFRWRNWTAIIGPSVVMAAAAIGGGEWLTGPQVTARFGPALLWLSAFSIIGQVIYNIEISRYALYTGEPIFTGKFRTLPGPMFWLCVYLLLDCGSFLPYLASSAAIPLFAMLNQRMPDLKVDDDKMFVTMLGCGMFLAVLLPLLVGGKVYNSIKAIMAFKLVVVLGFLMFLAVFYSKPATWVEISTGFLKVGTVPIPPEGDANHNGKRDEGEPELGPNTDNVFSALFDGRSWPLIDMTVIGLLGSMVAISGNGGLTNTPISNFTREQGWGMGKHVGAIPSIVGGHAIELSHVGMVFKVTHESLERWKGWLGHVQREQLCIWMPACFLGIALPSMLSVQFLARGTVLDDKNLASAMTAGGVQEAAGPTFGPFFWYMTMFCGLLVLMTSMVSTADGVLRRWVDVCWTALPSLRKWDTKHIGKLYFGVLCVYAICGMVMLVFVDANALLIFSGMLYNFALGFSCWHVVAVNSTLLPNEIRPSWTRRISLIMAGLFFSIAATATSIAEVPKLMKQLGLAGKPNAVVQPATKAVDSQPPAK
ncbi:MAG: Nramp family divalent metal transporter [Planctomycetota bacterium]